MKAEINVTSSAEPYRAEIGKSILEKSLGEIFSDHTTGRCFILIDENVHRYHQQKIESVFNKLAVDRETMIVPQGENSKSVDTWSVVMDFLLTHEIRRNTPLVVMGGGVTGDLGGFAASAALRGVPLIHIPTTLLAMVDSSIGGKTGINHAKGKNLIGAFYQPIRVIADIDFLQTLPRGEWINGLSEILKYAAISDKEIFGDAKIFFEEDYNKIDPERLIRLIEKCVRIKAEIVAEDEFEGGVRAFLNYGHTFAHALEKASDYSAMSHGEAVYLGMLAAEELSRLTGMKVQGNFIRKFRRLYQYRVSKEALSSAELIQYMKSDKKRTNQHTRFVLLKDWQHPVLKTVTDDALIRKAWQVVLDEL
ncbi:MAG: 3-dehydroquinate synthase [Balneolaceae bacterium]